MVCSFNVCIIFINHIFITEWECVCESSLLFIFSRVTEIWQRAKRATIF